MNTTTLRTWAGAFCLLFALMALAQQARAQTIELLHTFTGPEGYSPTGLVQGSDGNFYGTSQDGGDLSVNYGSGYGTIFRMTPDWTVTALFSFEEDKNGCFPRAGLFEGTDGNLYGTTEFGGDLSIHHGFRVGNGTVWKMTPDGTLTTLCNFTTDTGPGPIFPPGLLQGVDGNFYGTTWNATVQPNTFPTFQVKPDGTLTILDEALSYLFQGGDGNLYRTLGGDLFKMSAPGVFTKLFSFGDAPAPSLRGSDGNFYGTTGATSNNCGTVFKMSPDGIFTTLVTFGGTFLSDSNGNTISNSATNGAWPCCLVQGRDGNLYGLTFEGGGDHSDPKGFGTVFQVTPTGRLTTLDSFNRSNGGWSSGPLIQGSDGNLYGVSWNADAIFRVVLPPPPPTLGLALVGNQVLLSWPTNAAGFTLQSSPDLSFPANWTNSTDTPSVVIDHYVVTNAVAGTRFYRLKQ